MSLKENDEYWEQQYELMQEARHSKIRTAFEVVAGAVGFVLFLFICWLWLVLGAAYVG